MTKPDSESDPVARAMSEQMADLMARIRAGDQEAAAQLVRQYEPLIRRMVRLRLEDQNLGRVFDSMDVCQSVLGSFFVRVGVGEYDLREPGQLVNLLIAMTKNKVAGAARREYRQKRDRRRQVAGDSAIARHVASEDETPSVALAGKELLEKATSLLGEDEKRIGELRAGGASWEEVAQELGGTAQARRVQYARAVARISQALGLEE